MHKISISKHPASHITDTRGGSHNAPTRIHLKPTQLVGGYAQISYHFNYYGPNWKPKRCVRSSKKNLRRLIGLKIKAQIAMVLNLDKCIGCHTCSVTCKSTWTNRPGAEYMWFNNVEHKTRYWLSETLGRSGTIQRWMVPK
ncbi:nitrate reductase subunit beta [Staphylococcus gallinarum]|uniref:Nitrate reductase subunit beta n=1 Tax=Staphylococcus gallinarum TaxID=1293 RepID=A0A380FMP2_STAGA|nr:nitrate reductase subunit beta [Staphylococcus gallinarum]